MTEQKSLLAQPSEEGGLTPSRVADLMEVALRSGDPAAVASLKELVGLAERISDRQAATAFDLAVLRVRDALPIVMPRTKKAGGVARDGGGGKEWWYTPLEKMAEILEPLLRKNGLWIEWSEEDGEDGTKTVACWLCGVGHRRSARITLRKHSLPGRSSGAMDDEATVSIAMRRALAMVLGIVTSDPEDEHPAATGGPAITEEQGMEIDTLLSQLDAKRQAAFLKWLGVGGVADIPAARFVEARNALAKAAGQ